MEIGKLVDRKDLPEHRTYSQNPFPGKTFKVLFLVFSLEQEEGRFVCSFLKLDIENASESNVFRLAYRKGSARGGDVTFTTKMGDVEKKFNTFYPGQVDKILGFAKERNLQEDVAILSAMKACLMEDSANIKSQLQTVFDGFEKEDQQGSAFSVCFETKAGRTYLEDLSVMRETITYSATEGKSNKYNTFSEGNDEYCSICLEVADKLHGFGSPLKFSTVDKMGFVSGFFKQKNNWKNYPICPSCARSFELGQLHVFRELRKYFYGRPYFMIPSLLMGDNKKYLTKALKILRELDVSYAKAELVISHEAFLMKKLGELADDKDQLLFTMLFYEENQTTKALKVKLHLENIRTTRFRFLFSEAMNLQKRTSSLNPYAENSKPILFAYSWVRTFFDKHFLEVTESVFRAKPISEKFFYAQVMQKIRTVYLATGLEKVLKYNFKYYTHYTSKEIKTQTSIVYMALMTWSYFNRIGLIGDEKDISNMKEELTKDTDTEVSTGFDVQLLKAFIGEHTDLFAGNRGSERSGVFTLGVLVRQVFNQQARNLDGATPFEKKLFGYNLDARKLRLIYSDALEKLGRYASIHAYKELKAYMHDLYFPINEKLNQIPNDELSFYFVAGLEYGNRFRSVKTIEDDKDN